MSAAAADHPWLSQLNDGLMNAGAPERQMEGVGGAARLHQDETQGPGLVRDSVGQSAAAGGSGKRGSDAADLRPDWLRRPQPAKPNLHTRAAVVRAAYS